MVALTITARIDTTPKTDHRIQRRRDVGTGHVAEQPK